MSLILHSHARTRRPHPQALAVAALTVMALHAPASWGQATEGGKHVAPAADRLAVPATPAAGATPVATPAGATGTEKSADKPVLAPGQPSVQLRGNDRVIGPAKAVPEIPGTNVGLRFEAAALADVVAVVLREIAKVDYIIHPPINGTVTLATQGPVTAEHAFVLLETALQANGLLMARDARGIYHVGAPEAVKAVVPAIRQTGGSTPLPPGYGAVVIPLKYIGANEMATILRSMAPADAVLRVDPLRNLLVMAGTRTQAEGWLDIVNTFDVDVLSGMSVALFPLKHVNIKDVQEALQLIGGDATIGAAAPAATSGATPGQGAALGGGQGVSGRANAPSAAARATVPSLARLPVISGMQIIPVERLNSVLVVSTRAAAIDQARGWLEKLDRPGFNSSAPQLFVYRVQHGSAAHLSSLVAGLFGGSMSSAARPGDSGVSPDLRSTQLGAGNLGLSGASRTGLGAAGSLGAALGGSGLAASASQTTGTAQGAGVSTVSLPSGLRVMADEVNNALVIYGTPAEYEAIESAMKRLDVPPTQVLIEASIVEVTLTDELQYGLQWVFSDKQRGGYSGGGAFTSGGVSAGNLNNLGSNNVSNLFGATAGGFTYSLSNALGVRAVLNMLAEQSLIKVISSPSLMVLDNHTARITVGDQTPVRVGESVTSTGVVTNNIQYKDTGVSLQVTPSVNASDMVSMRINQAVTDVGPEDVVTNQRSFLQRQFESRVAVRSGETIVLGGLIRDNSTSSHNGLPGLKDVPVFGSLFGGKSRNSTRTELLVMITPRVARTPMDISAVGEELRDRLKSLKSIALDGEVPTPAQPLNPR